MRIGDRMKQLREEKDLMQQEVCSALGLEQSTLANYENNRRVPKTDILISIANYYGVSLDYLVGRTNNRFDNSKRHPKDLNKFLEQAEIVFDGDTYNLSDDERQMVMKSLEVAFYAAKQANKRKKSDTTDK
ncbi:helix-turn-helix domain-containing protein [Megasphaera massiliensis]|uniref:helix-turn-helix domain-containing protein n=1 Tax=Megasphaera massiliensis TaxID=1232428 RepID=UPI0005C953B1|nr:helix-turn-helix transcriptional regulator [Megasphaera massiliensis]MCQ5211128.1 helix-turn-helix domain-containing protein [Megasphaera massiliensis]DAF68389.1 MAG TPA: Repressor protein CI [Caudoviricetes sp.]